MVRGDRYVRRSRSAVTDRRQRWFGLCVVIVASLALLGGTTGTVAATSPASPDGDRSGIRIDDGHRNDSTRVSCSETASGARLINQQVRYELSGDDDADYVDSIDRVTSADTTETVVSPTEAIGYALSSDGERYEFASVVNRSVRRAPTIDGTVGCVFNVTRRYAASNGRSDDIIVQTTSAILPDQPGVTTRIEIRNVGSETVDLRNPASTVEPGIRLGTIELAEKRLNYRFFVPMAGLNAFENTSAGETYSLQPSRPAAGVFNTEHVLGIGYVDGETPPAGVTTAGGDSAGSSDALTFSVERLTLGAGESANWTIGTATIPMGRAIPDVSTETLGKAQYLTQGKSGVPLEVDTTASRVRAGNTTTLSISLSNPSSVGLSPSVSLDDPPAGISVMDRQTTDGSWRSNGTWQPGTISDGTTVDGSVRVAVPAGVPVGDYQIPVTVTVGDVTRTETLTVTVDSPPNVVVEPGAVRFGELSVDETASKTVTVRNTGGGELRVRATRFAGGDEQAFTIDGTTPFTLSTGESRDLRVTLAPETGGSKSTTLQFRTNDPDRPVADVWVTTTETVVQMSRTRQNNVSSMNVTMENVESNETYEMTVADQNETNTSATLAELNFTAAESIDSLNMTVTQSPRRMGSMTDTNLSNGTEPVNFFEIDHSVSNDAISGVNLSVQVTRSRIDAMDDTDPDEVALYRSPDDSDEWNEVPTELCGQTDEYYKYCGTADGFSEWATGAKQPQFSIREATVNVSAVRTGRTVLVKVRITNEGGADGQFDTDLLINDDTVASQQVGIASGGTRQVTFERAFDEAGTYRVQVNDRFAGDVDVSGGETEEEPDTTDSSLPVLPIAVVGAILVVAVGAGALYRREG